MLQYAAVKITFCNLHSSSYGTKTWFHQIVNTISTQFDAQFILYSIPDRLHLYATELVLKIKPTVKILKFYHIFKGGIGVVVFYCFYYESLYLGTLYSIYWPGNQGLYSGLPASQPASQSANALNAALLLHRCIIVRMLIISCICIYMQ